MNNPLESDWKIFSKRIPEWRERYLDKKIKKIISILSDKNKTPTELFWNAKKTIDEETKILSKCLDGYSRSKMELHLILLYKYKFIFEDDLNEFSKELKERIIALSQI